MIGRACVSFICAAFMAAFLMPAAQGHDLPCFDKSQADLLQPRGSLRGYGLTEEGLIRLSVLPSGAFVITFTPPSPDGMVCLVWMGEGWRSVGPNDKAAQNER